MGITLLMRYSMVFWWRISEAKQPISAGNMLFCNILKVRVMCVLCTMYIHNESSKHIYILRVLYIYYIFIVSEKILLYRFVMSLILANGLLYNTYGNRAWYSINV